MLLARRWRRSVSTTAGGRSRRRTRLAAGEGVASVAMAMILTQEAEESPSACYSRAAHDAFAGTARPTPPLPHVGRVRLERSQARPLRLPGTNPLPQRPQ